MAVSVCMCLPMRTSVIMYLQERQGEEPGERCLLPGVTDQQNAWGDYGSCTFNPVACWRGRMPDESWVAPRMTVEFIVQSQS